MVEGIVMVIRIFLTCLLIYGVYTETGKWTAIALFFIFVSIELLTLLIKKLNDLHFKKGKQ